MSSSENIDELRQNRDRLQAGLDSTKNEIETRKKSIATLESRLLAIEDGDKGLLNRLARFIKATKSIEKLKQQLEELTKEVGALTSQAADFQADMRDHLHGQIRVLNGNDENGLQRGVNTFQQKLDDALAKLNE